MSMTINTNVASLNAQRNLSGSQGALSTSLQRLSSGLRINSAKDDAAGLAISERMSSQINGMDQARRNANDGISLAQTAEGGMTSASDMLQRMRQLAVQSANDTNSASDRKALQSEVNQLKEELNRLVDTTQFNGKNILDGSLANAQFQVGANANQTINVSVGSIRGTDIGNYQATTLTGAGSKMGVARTAATNPGANGVTAGMDFSIAGNGKTAAIDVGPGESAKSIAAKVNANTGSTGVTATAETKATLSGISAGTVSFSLKGDNATAVTISATVGGDMKTLTEAVNAQTATTGISAKITDSGELELSNKNGADIQIGDFYNTNTTKTVTVKTPNNATGITLTGLSAGTGNDSTTISGTISFDSNTAFSITTAAAANVGVVAQSANGAMTAVDAVDLSTAASANNALKVLDAALSTVNSRRADLGAVQNRFTNTIANLQSSSENLNAARGRILDADFAAETAKLSRNQVLQQAGTAMLAQANQLPQQVLQLLR